MSLTAQPTVPNIGKMPGENISSMISSGSLGTSTRIFMRCGSSIQPGNEPLFVVDGVLYESNQIKFLDPNNIERIDILKSAAVSELNCYKASSGIIIINTKKAYQKKFTIKDEKDRVGIPFATFTAISLKTGDSISLIANEYGRIETSVLKTLEYKIKISCIGYKTIETSLKDIANNNYEIYLEKDIICIKEISIQSTIYRRNISCGAKFQTVFGKGIEENKVDLKNEIKIFPNPVKQNKLINLKFEGVKEGVYRFCILNSIGQLLFTFQKQITSKDATEQIQLNSRFSSGVYIIQVINEKKKLIHSSKLIIE